MDNDDFSKDMSNSRFDNRVVFATYTGFIPQIAVAIITYNRPESFNVCLAKHKEFAPPNSTLFIVDGGSDTDYANADYKFNDRVNISTVKNKALQLCYESGAKNVFIFEDDCYPYFDNWHLLYTKSGENHLCFTFYPSIKVHGYIKEHRLANGCMMYFKKICLDSVGGFDTKYPSKYEHIDLTNRIHNANLTRILYGDALGSERFIYSLDEHNEIPRSFTSREMQDNLKSGYEYFRSREGSSEYIEFRT